MNLTCATQTGSVTIRVATGWQHIWNLTHYWITPHQAARLRAAHALHDPERAFYVAPKAKHVAHCPHCTPFSVSGHTLFNAEREES